VTQHSIAGSAGPDGHVRQVEPRTSAIISADDLGGAEVLKHGNRFVVSDAAGDIEPDGRGLGVYDGDTRILSMARLRLGSRRPTVLGADADGGWRGTVHATNPELDDPPPRAAGAPDAGRIPAQTLALARERWIDTAYHERVTVTNHGDGDVATELEFELDVDMADIFEVRGYPRRGRGALLPIEIDDLAGTITFGYAGLDGVTRRTELSFDPRPSVRPAAEAAAAEIDRVDGDRAGRPAPAVVATWRLELAPGATRSLAWTARAATDAAAGVSAAAGGGAATPARHTMGRLARPAFRADDPEGTYRDWRAACPAIECDNRAIDAVLRRSIDDLCLLMNATPEGRPYVAAGIPWFSALFGRDALLAGIESVAFSPWIAVESLEALASRQSTVDDPVLDAEPGKILHELRVGEMARAGEVPFAPYYGSVDATPLFLVALGIVHDWSADDALVDRLWPNVEAALAWIEARERDGVTGFIEYRPRTTTSFPNQGWKDSPDAIRDGSGRLADPPIALAEVQGYAYDARRRMARLARRRGATARAAAIDAAADALRSRFALAFRPVRGVIPMALDGHGRPMDAPASNMGHCLWSGIVPDADTAAVAARLMADDLFSGWGTRSYAAGRPGYNPIGYHTGTVWPHDTAIVAAGLKARGVAESAHTLASAVLEAAEGFPGHRLPELFCGFDRPPDEDAVPVGYPVACSPQAWSAATPLFLVQTLLGMRPDAAAGRLDLIRPHLPPSVGRLAIRGLRVGGASCDLVAERRNGRTRVEITRADAGLTVEVSEDDS
jgi:glycogen debranching enzyme